MIWPMVSPRSTAGLVWAGLVCLAVAGCDMHHGAPLEGRASDEWTRTYTLDPGGEFQVVGAVGSIDVKAGSGSTIDVRAERIVRARTDAAAQPMVTHVRIGEDVASDKIVLRSDGLGGIVVGAEVEVNFHITVPAATRLRLRATGGDITLADVTGAVVASSTNGGIVGKGLGGGVDARSTNGPITIDLAALSRDPVDLQGRQRRCDAFPSARRERQHRGELYRTVSSTSPACPSRWSVSRRSDERAAASTRVERRSK